MSANLALPFIVEQPRSLLLAPLRQEIDVAEAQVREALAQLCAIDGCECGPFQDEVSCVLDSVDIHAPRTLARDAAKIGRQAARGCRRRGYDTWSRRDRARLVSTSLKLEAALRDLHAARQALHRAEIEELAALRRTA